MDTKRRYRFLDLLRGFSLLNMLAYHAIYDLVYLFGVSIPWYLTSGAYWWQQMICGTFILLSGISCRLSRNNGKRGLELFALGMVLTLGTFLFMPNELICFGILHFLGISCLLVALAGVFLRKLPEAAGCTVSLFLFLFSRGASDGYLGLFGRPFIRLPAFLYETSFLFPLGFPGPGFASSDYFPLLPWFFLFLFGFYLWPVLSKGERLQKADANLPSGPVSWVGRHTLPIYMLHQPVLYGIFWLLRLIGAI